MPTITEIKSHLDALDPRMFHALLAAIIGGLYYLLRKTSPALFERIPKQLQPLPALLLAAGANVYASGNSGELLVIAQQLGLGMLDGVLAIGGHHALKALPGPYGSSAASSSKTEP